MGTDLKSVPIYFEIRPHFFFRCGSALPAELLRSRRFWLTF
jgi:hypothetical protein